ncbi:uncharacterized protein LOC113306697 isoform X1 [Papaver somniferum]|uniref:uncharacterized protein LOC113306697 isoform X1 n=1 Tax=Papaver somniferum TaxID=3469 RepID=UPI000E6F93C8|nr:uncharacterized protein LOC113306697 isoform X1 [Papaver somniferum]
MIKFAEKDAFHLRVRLHLRINNMLSCAGADDSRLVLEEHLVNPSVSVPELALFRSYNLFVVPFVVPSSISLDIKTSLRAGSVINFHQNYLSSYLFFLDICGKLVERRKGTLPCFMVGSPEESQFLLERLVMYSRRP